MTICKRKRPVGSGVWSGYAFDEDDDGLWAYTPAGSTYVGYDGIRHEMCEVAQDLHGLGRDSLVLLPRGRWFVAHFVWCGPLLAHVDVATPSVGHAGVWSYDDLELDPYLTEDETFGVEDEDEFEAAYASGLISDEERQSALDAVTWLADALASRNAPLAATGGDRLREARALRFPPIHPKWPTRTICGPPHG